MGGIVAVSGIAAVTSGANSRDAILRSAVSVITVYLYNDIARMKEMNQRSGPITLSEIRGGISNISTTTDSIATACLMVANIPCATVFGTTSLVTSGTALLIDVELDDANLVDGANYMNSVVSGALLPKYAVEALPTKFELPTLIILDSYGKFTGFMFSEASSNHGENND